MTDDRLTQIKQRLAAVTIDTEHPWHEPHLLQRDYSQADAELIAHAPEDIAWLVAELRAARAVIGVARKLVEHGGPYLVDDTGWVAAALAVYDQRQQEPT